MDLLLCLITALVTFIVTSLIYQIKIRKLLKRKVGSYEVKELLHDLTTGRAMVEIRRVDPSSIFLRSPRGVE